MSGRHCGCDDSGPHRCGICLLQEDNCKAADCETHGFHRPIQVPAKSKTTRYYFVSFTEARDTRRPSDKTINNTVVAGIHPLEYERQRRHDQSPITLVSWQEITAAEAELR